MATAPRPSSTVQLQLIVGEKTLGLSRISRNAVSLLEPQELPIGDAEVLLQIDGHCRTWPVTLIHGAVPYENEVEIAERTP